jgi:hypothetical protein
LLEPDGIGRAVAGHLSLDLVEALLVIEHRDRGMAAVRGPDAQLTAEHPADAVGNVELDLASLRQRLDRMVDHGAFLERGIGQIDDRHPEHAAVMGGGIDPRRHRAAVISTLGSAGKETAKA